MATDLLSHKKWQRAYNSLPTANLNTLTQTLVEPLELITHAPLQGDGGIVTIPKTIKGNNGIAKKG